MTIIFLNPFDNKIYIGPENEVIKSFQRDDPELINYIPNDDILYVKDGCVLNKTQFVDYLEGRFTISINQNTDYPEQFDSGFRFSPKPTSTPESPNQKIANTHRLYIHPKHNGTILITDIQTKKFPEGIEMIGKYHFMDMDDIGQDVLEESMQFKGLLAKGKIEIVNHDFYMQNKHKARKRSPGDAALDAIIIQDQRRGAARRVSESGGLSNFNEGTSHTNDPIEIYVE